MNTGYVLFDFCINAIPVRLLHFYQPLLYGTVYFLFTICYWQLDGTNEEGSPYIYEILDYDDNLGKALGFGFVMLGAAAVIHVIWWALYRFKVFIYTKCGCIQKPKGTMPTANTQKAMPVQYQGYSNQYKRGQQVYQGHQVQQGHPRQQGYQGHPVQQFYPMQPTELHIVHNQPYNVQQLKRYSNPYQQQVRYSGYKMPLIYA